MCGGSIGYCVMCVGRKGWRFKGGKGQFAVIMGRHRVASVRDGRELSQVVGGCHMQS